MSKNSVFWGPEMEPDIGIHVGHEARLIFPLPLLSLSLSKKERRKKPPKTSNGLWSLNAKSCMFLETLNNDFYNLRKKKSILDFHAYISLIRKFPFWRMRKNFKSQAFINLPITFVHCSPPQREVSSWKDVLNVRFKFRAIIDMVFYLNNHHYKSCN